MSSLHPSVLAIEDCVSWFFFKSNYSPMARYWGNSGHMTKAELPRDMQTEQGTRRHCIRSFSFSLTAQVEHFRAQTKRVRIDNIDNNSTTASNHYSMMIWDLKKSYKNAVLHLPHVCKLVLCKLSMSIGRQVTNSKRRLSALQCRLKAIHTTNAHPDIFCKPNKVPG